MTLHGSSVSELIAALHAAGAARQRISAFDLRSLDRILEHTPEDMTVTVEAGATLAKLQARLAEHNQWLPIDAPGTGALTIGALLAGNRSGPRRFGYGTVREHLIGLKVVLADGRVIKAGGKVVKNVAGYDLCKLFVGSRGTLGVIAEATFKVLPRPETETFLQAALHKLDDVSLVLESINQSPLTPAVFDLHGTREHTVVLGFAGAREDVESQVNRAQALGFRDSTTLDYSERFWRATEPPQITSVLPSKLIETMKSLDAREYLARAGNGVIYYRGGRPPLRPELPRELIRRIKHTYDPNHILPDLPW